jgi:hypothetical protein
MHPTLDSLAIILFSAICLYMCFLIYLKVTKSETIKDLLSADKLEEYKKIKNKPLSDKLQQVHHSIIINSIIAINVTFSLIKFLFIIYNYIQIFIIILFFKC